MIEITFRTIMKLVLFVGGGKKQTIELEENADVNFLLRKMTDIYGDQLKEAIFDEDGNIRKGITMYKNGVSILALDGVNTIFHNGDDFLVFPPVGGG